MKRNALNNVFSLDAWNPKTERIEQLTIVSNRLYEIELENGYTGVYLLDMSDWMAKKIKKAFNSHNPSLIAYSAKWDGSLDSFIEDFGVIDVETIKHMTEVRYRFIKRPVKNGAGCVVRELEIRNGVHVFFEAYSPTRVQIVDKDYMPETVYGEYIDYVPPKFFGLFGGYIKFDKYNHNDVNVPFIERIKIKTKKILHIDNGDVSFVTVKQSEAEKMRMERVKGTVKNPKRWDHSNSKPKSFSGIPPVLDEPVVANLQEGEEN